MTRALTGASFVRFSNLRDHMPDIILYGVAVSAFVAKVRIVLDIKRLTYQEAPPPGGYGSPEYRVIIPAGSVPGLVIDGRPFHDSNAIVELLDEIAPEPRLAPQDPYDRARMRALLGFHDTRLEAAARALFPVIKSDWRATPDAVAAGRSGIEAALSRLEDLVEPKPFAFGDAPTLADVAYPVTIQMALMLGEELEAPVALSSKVADWIESAAEIEAVARSLRIAGDAMEDWLAQFRGAAA